MKAATRVKWILFLLIGFSGLSGCGNMFLGGNGNSGSGGSGSDTYTPAPEEHVAVADWQGNTKAALLMYFDDSTPGQAELAIPLLNSLHLVGTFFVNPGGGGYAKHPEVWEHYSQTAGGGCQELANHTMNHSGAADYEEADYEIGEPSRIIWQARGEPEYGSLIAYNRGGGTAWNITDEQHAEILARYKNIDRLKPGVLGEGMAGTQILPGSDAQTILRNRAAVLNDEDAYKILMLSFHGIAAENGSPPLDWGNGAVFIDEFSSAMDTLKNDVDNGDFWSAGYIQLYRYIQERKNVQMKLFRKNQRQYKLEMRCPDLDGKFFNESLTVLVDFTEPWNNCTVFQNNQILEHRITDGKLQFDAVPSSDFPVYIEMKADYYVSPDGSDLNPGTEQEPFQTMSRALSCLPEGSGGIILLKDGHYAEYLDINKSGSEANPLRIMAENTGAAKVRGFRVLGSGGHVRISGFEIESDMSQSNDKKGIINNGASHVEISDCYIHDCPGGGIAVLQNAGNVLIRGNTIEHNGFYGVFLDGNNSIIENNIICRTVQNHPKFTGSGIPIPPGADADGIIIYGHHHTIRHNSIVDLALPAEENTNPHSDAIQSGTGASSTVLRDAEIYGNYIRNTHPSGKGIILEAGSDDTCRNIVIASNIVEFTDIGVANGPANLGHYSNIKICNNVFKASLNQSSWGTAVWLKNVEDYDFVNNITIDCKNEHRKITGGSGTADYNLCCNSDGSSFSMTPSAQSHEIIGELPLFVRYTGVHGQNDYHLTSGSPAVDSGQDLFGSQALTRDFDGNERTPGSWDIGAFVD